jgi:hypothetical protein
MAPRKLAPLVLSALLASACTYDFQEFVGSEATGGGGSGASGGASRGGESNGGSTSSGGSTKGGASAKGGASNGGSASAAGGKSSSGGASSGGRTASGGTPSTAGGGGSSSGGAAAGAGGSKACAGTALNSICWYLGAANQSCTDVCSAHAGVNTASEKMVGVPAQGGSLTSCALVLAALGTRDLPAEATRSDGNGLGCHVISGRSDTAYWLSSPRFSETAHLSNASIACGCNQ